MIRDDLFYATSNSEISDEWYDAHGFVHPQPTIAKHTESPAQIFQDGMEMNSYYNAAIKAIKIKFAPASNCHDLNIKVDIQPDGSVVSTELLRSSGNATLDKNALAALKMTKFPPLYGAHQRFDLIVGLGLQKFLSTTFGRTD